MNILIFNWQDIKNPFAGGAEVHLHEVFSRIAAKGHGVTLFCSMFPGARRQEDINGIRVIREGGRYLFNIRVARAYRSRFRGRGYDIVVDDMNKIPFFTPLYVREPVYGVTHHLFGGSIFRETNPLIGSYVWLAERAAVSLYRRRRIPFIVGSPSTRTELLERDFKAEDIAIVNYAVDHRVHRPTGVPKSAGPLIGYFGRLKKYKSIDHLLQSLPEVLKQVPALRIMIVGEGDDRARLEHLTAELGLGHAVEFTGYVTEEMKVELMQRMWFKVTTSSKEGWGLTVLEANACGTPVIASDVQGLRDAVRDGDTGLLYRYGDIRDLAGKIIRLLGDGQLRERLGAGALAWARTFSWDAAAEQTLSLLEERLKSSAVPRAS